MTKTVRDVLNEIEKVLNKGGEDSQDLWNVLSALRGPDDEGMEVKSATTGVIRGKAFPNCPFLLNEDSELQVKVRTKLEYSHFRTHAKSAFDMLGLSWEETND